MELKFINEFQINKNLSREINALLKESFIGIDYKERDYFKQLPHYRILATENGILIGQLAIDFRVMNLNGFPLKVFGIIDLCVLPKFRKKGIATKMINKFESLARSNSEKIDFMFLVTDTPNFYKSLGFEITKIKAKWLKIDSHKSHAVENQRIEDAFFMIKPVSDIKWKNGELDFLGYMY